MEIINLFIKFSVVGLSGVAVNLAIYSILIYFNVYYLLAAVFSFMAAVSNNFYWNFIWTFKDKGKDKTITNKYFGFFLISLFNFCINLLFLKILHDYYGLHQILSQAIAIAIASILNFFGNYFITFRDKEKGEN